MGKVNENGTSSTAGQPIHCKAAVLWTPGSKCKMESVTVSAPKKNQVRIKLSHVSICHTDLTIAGMKELAPLFPAIFGHEGAGIVESVGECVTNVQAGDHVLLFMQGQCEECSNCKTGRTNICSERPVSILSPSLLGDDKPVFKTEDGTIINGFCGLSAFSEYTVVHKDTLVKVSREAPLEKICLLGCALPTGIGAATIVAKVLPGSTVAVFGLGTIGLAVVQGCKLAGASRIIGVDSNPTKASHAKEFGVTDFINPKEHNSPVPQVIQEMTGGGVEYSFECVGAGKLMTDAVESTAVNIGKTVIVGLTSNPTEKFEVNAFSFIRGKSVSGTMLGGFKLRDLPELVEKCMRKEVELDPYITHRLPFSKINEAMDVFKSGSCLRCVLEMGS